MLAVQRTRSAPVSYGDHEEHVAQLLKLLLLLEYVGTLPSGSWRSCG